MSILVSCSCGKKLRVGDDKAGKRIRCPGCQEVLLVEEEETSSAVQASAPPPKPKAAPKPSRRVVDADDDVEDRRPIKSRAPAGDDDDEETNEPVRPQRRRNEEDSDDDERPVRGRKRAASSRKVLWLSLAGLATVACGAAVYFLFLRGSGTAVVKGPDQKPEQKKPKDKEATPAPDAPFTPEEAEARLNSINNLKMMGLGFHNHELAKKQLPAADGSGVLKEDFAKGTLTGLSWRAHLLTSLDGGRILFDMFQGKYPPASDKPGDEWNRPDLKNVDFRTFANPRRPKGQDAWLTPYRVFVGPGTAFEPGKTLSITKDFPDGTGNTIFAVEAPPVPWTKPDELPYDPNQPLPKLGGLFDDGFYALFVDGHVRFIPHTTDEKTIRAMITRNGGEKVELPEHRPQDSFKTLRLIIAKGKAPMFAGEPKETSFGNAANFQPLDLGNHWHYRMEGRTLVHRVVDSQKDGDGVRGDIQTLMDGRPSPQKEQFRQDSKGVEKQLVSELLNMRLNLLRYPVKTGDKWEGEVSVGPGKGSYFCQVAGEETIDVPAGKFKTVRVFMLMEGEREPVTMDTWFAPDVGMVKQAIDTGFGPPMVLELAKFEPKKKLAAPKYSPEEAKARLISVNNLKQLGLAFHNHQSVARLLPPADGSGVLKDRFGKGMLTGLSWRAHVLPYVEGDAILNGLLQGKYPAVNDKPGEEWNRPDLKNLEFIVFANPRSAKGQDAWLTPYRVFVGPGTAFEPGKKISLTNLPDGSSNTILAVEASPVPWTKPEELPYDPKQPLPKLGGLFADGFHALFADGAVRFIPHSTDEKTIRAMITRDGGESFQMPADDGDPDLDPPPDIKPPVIKIPVKIPVKMPVIQLPFIEFNKTTHRLMPAAENMKYLEDRDYAIAKLPAVMRNGQLLVRDAKKVNDWLPPKQLSLSRPGTIYAAVMVQFNDEARVSAQQLQSFTKDGWRLEPEVFAVHTAEKWDFRVLSKDLRPGLVNLPLPPGLEKYRTQTIFVLQPEVPDTKIDIKDLLKDLKIPDLKIPEKLPEIKLPDIKLPQNLPMEGEQRDIGRRSIPMVRWFHTAAVMKEASTIEAPRFALPSE